MTEYTPPTWGTGSQFQAAQATAMAAELDEQEGHDLAQDAQLVGLASTTEASGAMRNLMSKLTEGVSNATIVMNSDSTGATSDSWLLQNTQWLAAQFPAYTVNYYLWDEGGNQWPASPTWTDTGTGAYTLNVWNAGVGGSSTGYFQGSRFPNLVKDADLIIVNHGFNQGGPLSDDTQRQYRRNMYLAFVDEFVAANPNAGVVLIGQPPDGRTGREGWQAQKNLEFAKVAAWRGWGFINVHRKWVEYGNWQADLTLGDQVHPTAAGLALWAATMQAAMKNALRVPVTTQPPLGGAGSQVFKNPQLSAWGGALPDGVTSAVNCTVTKELTDFETGTHAMKITSTAASGFSYVELTGTAEQWGIKGRLANQTYTAAVRLKVPAANTATVRVALLDNNGNTYTMATDVAASPAARDRYIWVYCTKAFPANANLLTMWIIARTSGTAIVEVLVDEIRLTPGASAQPGISTRDTLGALPAADNDFAQRVLGVWVPRTPAQVRTALGLDLAEFPVERFSDGFSTLHRMLPGGNAAIVSGRIQLEYFTAPDTWDAASIYKVAGSIPMSGTAPTMIKFGVYSVASNGDLTLIAVTANDTSLFTVAFASATKAFVAPCPFVRGNRYAAATLVITAGTIGNMWGTATMAGGMLDDAPTLAKQVTGQTDLPSSIPTASATGVASAYTFTKFS